VSGFRPAEPGTPPEHGPPSGRPPVGGLSIRTALLLGFALVFGLWVASASYLIARAAEVEERSAAAYARHEAVRALLQQVREQVLLSSIYVRDALDASDEAQVRRARFYRRQLQEARWEIDRTLERLVPAVDSPAEREHWALLQAELDAYWDSMLPVLDEGGATAGGALVRTSIVPRRQVVIGISDRLWALAGEELHQQQASLDALHQNARRGLRNMTAGAVILGLLVAVLAVRHAGDLESRIRAQHREVLGKTRELQQLSARLLHVQEDERRAIARELHDEVGQSLLAIKADLAVLARHVISPGNAADVLEEARATADGALQSVRNLSQLLRPPTLDDFGLPDTLTWYLRKYGQRTGIRSDLVQEGLDERLPPQVEVAAYRIVQEALSNVARHAGARSCRVELRRWPTSLVVTVEDDGCGLDRAPEGAGGLGLIGIRERASELGGTFRLQGAPGTGVRMVVELPVPDANEAAFPSPGANRGAA